MALQANILACTYLNVPSSLSCKINVLLRVVFALMQMPFDGSVGFLTVGGNPVHDHDHWRVFR